MVIFEEIPDANCGGTCQQKREENRARIRYPKNLIGQSCHPDGEPPVGIMVIREGKMALRHFVGEFGIHHVIVTVVPEITGKMMQENRCKSCKRSGE